MTRKSFEVADRNWIDLGSDINWVDHGGLWARKVSDSKYITLEFENCEDWGDGATGYCVTVCEVDLERYASRNYDRPAFGGCMSELESAMKCCDVPADGLDQHGEPLDPEVFRRMKVQACNWYGAKKREHEAVGNNVRKLVAEAKRVGRGMAT